MSAPRSGNRRRPTTTTTTTTDDDDSFRDSAPDLRGGTRDTAPSVVGGRTRRHRARSADGLRSRTRSTERVLSSNTTTTSTSTTISNTSSSNDNIMSSFNNAITGSSVSVQSCGACGSCRSLPSSGHRPGHVDHQQQHHRHRCPQHTPPPPRDKDQAWPWQQCQCNPLLHHERFYYSELDIHQDQHHHHQHHHSSNNLHNNPLDHHHHHHHIGEDDDQRLRRRQRRRQQRRQRGSGEEEEEGEGEDGGGHFYASQSSLPSSSGGATDSGRSSRSSSRSQSQRSRRSSSASGLGDGGSTLNLSMCGCGFLGVYHLGVVWCLLRHGPSFLARLDRVAGASAGALAAALLVTSPSLRHVQTSAEMVSDMAKKVRRKPLGALTPGCRMSKQLERLLDRVLPPDAHVMAHGKLHVSLTDVSAKHNQVVSEFSTRAELIEALVASCHVPFYSGLKFPSVKGKHCCDGGLTNNLVTFSDGRTVTVSPFSGQQDIGPRDPLTKGTKGCFFSLQNHDLQANVNNLRRASHAIFPPRSSILQEYFELGHKDASRFLIREGIYEIQMPPERPPLMYESSV